MRDVPAPCRRSTSHAAPSVYVSRRNFTIAGPAHVNPEERPNRIRGSLVALSAAAVLTVYTAGYGRTRAAAQRFASETAERRPVPSTAEIAPRGRSSPETADSDASGTRAPSPGDTSHRPAAVASNAGHPAATPKTKGGASPGSDTAPGSVGAADSAISLTPVATMAAAAAPPANASSTAIAGVSVDSASHLAEKPRVPYRDGVYSGWGSSRHGDIQASVEIKDGRIVSAYISQCLTRYSCSWISRLPPQVVARQSADVDYVSGATQSTNAFYYAIVEALSKAK